MSKTRLNLIEMAFKKLDKTGDGVVTLDDLRGVYNTKSHPEYQNGQKTEKELLEGYLKKFEEGGAVDGKVCNGLIVYELKLFIITNFLPSVDKRRVH